MNLSERLANKATLQEFAVGSFQANTRKVGEFLAPTVLTPSRIGELKIWTEKTRFHVPNTLRASGAYATQIASDARDVSYHCAPNALDIPIDRAVGDQNLELLKRDAIEFNADIYGLAHLYEVVTKAKAAAGAGANFVLEGAFMVEDIVQKIDDEIETVLKAGKCENVGVLFGADAWRRFKRHLSLSGLVQVINWNLNPSLFTADAQYMGCFSVIDAAPEGIAPAMEFILKDEILVFGRNPNPTRRDSSFMKTLRHSDYVENVKVTETDDGRKVLVQLDWSAEIQVTNSAAVRRINLLPGAAST